MRETTIRETLQMCRASRQRIDNLITALEAIIDYDIMIQTECINMDIIIKNIPDNVNMGVFIKNVDSALATIFSIRDIQYMVVNEKE